MLKRWRSYRRERFRIYRNRSTLRLVLLFGIVVILIIYLEKLR